MMQITPVVKNLIIVNVLMYFGTLLVLPEIKYLLAVFYPASDNFRIWQVITYMFMHGDEIHLLFNMYALYMFGTILEMSMGAKRFLQYYIYTGIGALVFYMAIKYAQINFLGVPVNINIPMLGASGSVFGLLAGFGMLYPNRMLGLIFPPITLKAKYFVLIYGAIELYLGVSGANTGIAHFAHLGGAIFGALILMSWGYVRRGR